MIMLGGSMVFIGPLIGAVLLQTIEHFVTIYTEHNGLVLGLIILIAVLGFRRGIGDFAYEYWQRRREARAPVPAPQGSGDRRGLARGTAEEERTHDARA